MSVPNGLGEFEVIINTFRILLRRKMNVMVRRTRPTKVELSVKKPTTFSSSTMMIAVVEVRFNYLHEKLE